MALSTIRLPARWRVGLENLQQALVEDDDVRLIALASSFSMAKTIRYAAAVGARNVLMDAPELEAWRDALQRARVGPLEWSVALSLEFLKDSIEPARTKLGTGARNYDDATILRTFILLGSRRLEKRHQRGGSIGLL